MPRHRFLVHIGHPEHGRITRFQVPHSTLHVLAGLALLATITVIGLVATFVRQSAEAERLVAENSALRSEYDNLLITLDERDQQVRSLSKLAYQVSIAYSIPREGIDAEAAFGTEMEPAFYASLNQYDQLNTVLASSSPGVPSRSLLANSTPTIWPVKGHISSSYGTRQDPFSGKGVFHPGLDISAPPGSPVVATADGYVVYAGWDGGLGHCVKVQHGRNGFRTIYGHLKEYFVREGQMVRRGEVLGHVGSSGRTTGNHVHYEVHYQGMKVNPYKYLRNSERTYEFSLAD